MAGTSAPSAGRTWLRSVLGKDVLGVAIFIIFEKVCCLGILRDKGGFVLIIYFAGVFRQHSLLVFFLFLSSTNYKNSYVIHQDKYIHLDPSININLYMLSLF